MERLLTTGYPRRFVLSLLQELKRNRDPPLVRRVRPVVIPYVHTVSHNPKKVAARHSGPVVFSAPVKLSTIVPRSGKRSNAETLANCTKRCTMVGSPVTLCGVHNQCRLWDPVLQWKGLHRQNDRCLSVRLREHYPSLKATPSGHLILHVRDCRCHPTFSNTSVLNRLHDKAAREITEAFFMTCRCPQSCVSSTPLALLNGEQYILQKWVLWCVGRDLEDFSSQEGDVFWRKMKFSFSCGFFFFLAIMFSREFAPARAFCVFLVPCLFERLFFRPLIMNMNRLAQVPSLMPY